MSTLFGGVEEDEADDDDEEEDPLEGDEFFTVFAGTDGCFSFSSEDGGAAGAGLVDGIVVDDVELEGSVGEFATGEGVGEDETVGTGKGEGASKGAGVDVCELVDDDGVIFTCFFAKDPHVGRALPGLSQNARAHPIFKFFWSKTTSKSTIRFAPMTSWGSLLIPMQ